MMHSTVASSDASMTKAMKRRLRKKALDARLAQVKTAPAQDNRGREQESRHDRNVKATLLKLWKAKHNNEKKDVDVRRKKDMTAPLASKDRAKRSRRAAEMQDCDDHHKKEEKGINDVEDASSSARRCGDDSKENLYIERTSVPPNTSMLP